MFRGQNWSPSSCKITRETPTQMGAIFWTSWPKRWGNRTEMGPQTQNSRACYSCDVHYYTRRHGRIFSSKCGVCHFIINDRCTVRPHISATLRPELDTNRGFVFGRYKNSLSSKGCIPALESIKHISWVTWAVSSGIKRSVRKVDLHTDAG